MSYQLVIPPEVEHEIAEAYESFESTERAFSFMRDINALFERIVHQSRDPAIWPR
jgi:hypothetical protein